MLSIPIIFAMVVSLAELSSVTIAANATCYPGSKSRGFQPHHCIKALENIVYENNQTLDDVSGAVFVFHKTCVINIQKPKRETPTRRQIENNIQTLLQNCSWQGGMIVNPKRVVTNIYAATKHNVYEINKPVCQKKRCKITSDDCLAAFGKIPIDHKGNLIAQNTAFSYTKATSGNCSVTISTTDYSSFRTSHPVVDPAFRKLINACGNHPGAIYLGGGTAGNNGDVRLAIRNLANDTCT